MGRRLTLAPASRRALHLAPPTIDPGGGESEDGEERSTKGRAAPSRVVALAAEASGRLKPVHGIPSPGVIQSKFWTHSDVPEDSEDDDVHAEPSMLEKPGVQSPSTPEFIKDRAVVQSGTRSSFR